MGQKGYTVFKSIPNQEGLDQYNASKGTPLAAPYIPPAQDQGYAVINTGTASPPRILTEAQRRNRRIFFIVLAIAAGYYFWPDLTAYFGTQNLILGLAAILAGYAAVATIGYVIRRIAATAIGSFIASAITVAIIAAVGIVAFAMLRSA